MLGIKTGKNKGAKDDGEKPFWISFSDLMTALMVLFLVAMAVALMAVTEGLEQIKRIEKDRTDTIRSCVDDIRSLTSAPEFKGVVVKDSSIEFGPLAEFRHDSSDLNEIQQRFLRQFVPRVLEVATHKSCQAWLKRVVVDGYASQQGSYLYNLNLSFKRSQRILCVLLDSKSAEALDLEQRKQIRSLFFPGASSFMSEKVLDPAQSRRVELRLEFWEPNAETGGADKKDRPDIRWDEDAKCPSDPK